MTIVAVAILALSMSSDRIGNFMKLPDWMPDHSDSASTFGSSGHTNATHRITEQTLSAVESVFEAYHERVFYASEGRSNTWDRSVYGPRPSGSDLLDQWFTNTTDIATNVFIYSTWTNAYQRAVPDSRRLLEFDNLFRLSEWIRPFVERRTGPPWLDKGTTWGTDRDIMFGSSWGPADGDLPSVDWTPNQSFRPDLASSCVPLCYCMTNSVFGPDEQTADGFLWDVLKDLDSNFNALYRIEGGPLPTYAVNTNGYLAEWHNLRSWTNSAASKMSVPGIITNHFPLSGPEAGMTNLTRRLVPDDSYVVNITSNYVEISEKTVSKMASECISLEGNVRPGAPGVPEYGVGVSVAINYTSPEYDRVNVFGVAHSSLADARMYPSAYFDFGLPPHGTDRVEVTVECNGLTISYSKQRPFDGYYVSEVENDAEVSVHMRYMGWAPETNFVVRASSLLATESRALAMLDRTYEIPKWKDPGTIPMSTSARDEERRMYSSLKASGGTVVTMGLAYPFTAFDSPIKLSDLISGATPEYEYSVTNDYRSIADPTVVKRRLNVGPVGAQGGMEVGDVPGRPSVPYTVEDLKRFLLEAYGNDDSIVGQYEVLGLTASLNFSTIVVSITTAVDYYDYWDYLFERSVEDLLPSVEVSVPVTGWVNVNRHATVFIGGVPGLVTFDRMYPWYGPGPNGFSDGVVGSSKVLFADAVLAFVSKIENDAPLVSWDSSPISLPPVSYHEEVRDRRFTWDSYHRLASSTPISGVPSGPYAKIYDEAYGSLRTKVDSEFGLRAGDYSSPQSLIPVGVHMASLQGMMATGVELSFEAVEEIYGGNPTFEIDRGPGGEVTITIYDVWGSEMSDDDWLLYMYLSVKATTVGEVVPSYGHAVAPVAVDGRLSPVIVTDWNWKALKSSR